MKVPRRKRLSAKKRYWQNPSSKKLPSNRSNSNEKENETNELKTDSVSCDGFVTSSSNFDPSCNERQSQVSLTDHQYVKSTLSKGCEDQGHIECECPCSLEYETLQEDVPLDQLLLDVKCKVEVFLPQRWVVIVNKEDIHVANYSISSSVVVQRSLVVAASGKCQLFVHSHSVNVEPFISDVEPPLPLEKDTVNNFVDRIVCIVNNIRKMEVCSGYDEPRYEVAWSTCPLGEIDRNPFKECRYVETFRSFTCARLVSARKWRCSECLKLYGSLRRRTKAAAAKERHPKTANVYLTEEQKMKKLQDQRCEIKKARSSIYRLQTRIHDVIKKEGIHVDQSLADDLVNIMRDSNVNPAQSIFLQQQIKASQQKNSASMRWHPTMLRFALALHLSSPAAYEMVRNTGMVKLPSSRTLFDYSNVRPVEEGIDKTVLESISERVDKMTEGNEKHKKYHVLMADEMYISQNLVFQKSTGRLLGYTSLDTIDQEVKNLENWLDKPDPESEPLETLASKVMVYMVKGVSNGIKEVVATYAVGNMSANQMYIWTWQVIGALERSGIAVTAFVTDGSSVNRAFIKKHKPATPHPSGIVFDTWNKAARDRKLYFIADVPHLLKTIRNCFLNSRWDGRKSRRKMIKSGKRISWDFVIKLYELKKGKTLRKSYKLSPMNVYPDSYARMKVKFAGQVLSKTVSKDLLSQGWADAVGTAIFIELINDWFDCLNGAHSSMGKKKNNENLSPYTSTNDKRFCFLDKFLSFLDEWEKEAQSHDQTVNTTIGPDTSKNIDEPGCDDSLIAEDFIAGDDTPASRKLLSKQTLDGIRMTTLAFQPLITFLLNEGVKFINARIFTQDPLEQHFSKVRAGQGGSNNPNVPQVLNRNRALHTIGQLGMKNKRGNSGESGNSVEVTSQPLEKRRCNRVPKFSRSIS